MKTQVCPTGEIWWGWAERRSERARKMLQSPPADGKDFTSGAKTGCLTSTFRNLNFNILLLVYPLANPAGGRLRDVQRWTGYSYRSISEVATRWEAASAADIDHGYCRLADSEPWRDLLKQGPEKIVLVDFFAVFEACIGLLRALAKARQKNFDWTSPVVTAHRRDAFNAISSSLLNDARNEATSVAYLCNLCPETKGG